jgi:hypothetical protein
MLRSCQSTPIKPAETSRPTANRALEAGAIVSSKVKQVAVWKLMKVLYDGNTRTAMVNNAAQGQQSARLLGIAKVRQDSLRSNGRTDLLND